MAFAYCPKCEWEQDDFWRDTYNPLRCLLSDEADLLNKPLDEKIDMDRHWLEENGFPNGITRRQLIVWRLQVAIRRVEKMVFRNEQEAKAAGWKCPRCGASLGVD